MPARLSILRALIALLLIIIILPFSRASGAGTPLPDLLGATVGAASTVQASGADQRSRSAVLNLGEVERIRADLDAGRSPSALALSLFTDTNLVARFEHIDHLQTGGYTFSGTIDGSRFGEIHLAVVGSALYASVNTGQGMYRISSPDGLTAHITQIDPNLLPPDEEKVPKPAPAAADPLAPAAVTAGPSTTDDGSRIDVYVGYTANASSQAGGTAAIQAVIATAIAETNTGYANSGINQRVVLVGSGEYAYNETGFDWNTALNQWSDPADAVFGPAHTLRNTLKADEMVLLVGTDPNYCGLAWLMGSGSISTSFATSSFAVVSWPCATGYYSFGHEMGHNMGAHHDRFTAGTEQGAYPYSYGFWILNPATSHYDWRTIMAYNVPVAYGYNSFRINYWSNPNTNYSGQPTGKPVGDPNSAYNALTLNNTAPVVAMFRDGNAPAAPTNLAVTPLSPTSYRLNWTDNSLDEMRFRIERVPNGLTTWAEIGTAAANTITYTDNTAVSGSAYQYRVLADNGNGRSVSNIASVPLPPSGLSIIASSLTSAALQWTDNSSNETLFRIKRAPAAVDTWTSVNTVGAGVTTYTDTTVPDGAGYRYQVFAENANGPSAGSNTAVLPAMPAAPSALTASGLSQTSLKLNWVDNATSEAGYKIERAPVGGSFTPLATLAGVNGVTYTDASVPATGEYQYRVYAYNSRGNSAYSGVVYGLPTKPTVPSNTVINNGQIDLSWTDNSQIENGYKVDRSLDGGASYQPLAALGANIHSYSDSTAACGTNSYRVYAYDAAGNSVYAATSGTTAPCKPVVIASPGTSAVFLTWAPASGAQSYLVQKLQGGNTYIPISPSIPAASPTSFMVTGLNKGTAYQFRVLANNTLGDTPSDQVNVTTMNFDVFLPRAIR